MFVNFLDGFIRLTSDFIKGLVTILALPTYTGVKMDISFFLFF